MAGHFWYFIPFNNTSMSNEDDRNYCFNKKPAEEQTSNLHCHFQDCCEITVFNAVQKE